MGTAARAIQIDNVAHYRIFESDERNGICYRIPSFVRSGRFIVAVAEKRFGFAPEITTTHNHKRPVRITKDKLRTVTPCGDEALISLVVKLALVKRSSVTNEIDVSNLEWSPEIRIVDMEKYLDYAIMPNSRFFEPRLFNYHARLKKNHFGKSSSYLACFDPTDCATLQRVKKRDHGNDNLFTSFLRENFATPTNPLNTDGQIANWLARGDNAKRLLNIRFGSQSAFNFFLDGQPFLGIAGVIAYPVVPHAPHNDFETGETALKPALVRVDLNSLWLRVKEQNRTFLSIDPADSSILEWKEAFSTRVTQNSIGTANNWLESARPTDEIRIFENKLAGTEFQRANLKEANGVDEEVTLPQSLNGVLQLAQWYANIDNPLIEPLRQNSTLETVISRLDLDGWKRATVRIYENADMFPQINLIRSSAVQALLNAPEWTPQRLFDVHRTLGIATVRDFRDNTVEQARLALVMSEYARDLNTRVNRLAAEMRRKSEVHNSAIGEYLRRIFFKKGRFGPGNAILLPAEERIFLPIAGGFPLTLSFDFKTIDTNHIDVLIKQGTERQAAIIGKTSSGAYGIFMTMRNSGMDVPKENRPEFDLSTWTRTFSVSRDSGRTWSPDAFVKPVYDKLMVSSTSNIPNIEEAGFESTEVQGSIASIPGFFGKGIPLVLHLHPQNNSRGLVLDSRTNQTNEIPCLGDDPADASKTTSHCDYRMQLQLIPGRVKSSWKTSDDSVNLGRDAVKWIFDKAFTVQSGSAGYSAIRYIGRDDCHSVKVGMAYEGTADDTRKYRGFNDGISVKFLKIRGADFTFMPACNNDREQDPSWEDG